MVATTTILGDVVANIVGDAAEVEVLMPSGASPHDYQASSQQVAAINRADLVVANGFGLEEGLEDVLRAAVGDGARVLEVATTVTPIPGNIGNDPHFWLDPVRMAEAVQAIGAELEVVDQGSDAWVDRADAYASELLEAHQQIEDVLYQVAPDDRMLVTNHDSFAYFGDRYGFEVVGVVIPGGSTLGDPSSDELAALVDVVETEEVPVIFAETTEASALAEAVADEVGRDIDVVDLYTGSLGDSGSGSETYIRMLMTNASLIANALS